MREGQRAGIQSQEAHHFKIGTVDQLQIAAIACRATGVEGRTPMNAAGVTLQSGEKLATYDWVATSVVTVPISD